MVCVAAIALGSSTYAWFVTNNKVDATTSTISAQSNAAFMTITNGTTGANKVDTTTVETKALYLATFGEEKGSTKGTFMTGYGTDLNAGTLKGALKAVHNATVNLETVTVGKDTALHVYLYYEGGDTTAEVDTSVNTKNLQDGKFFATNAVTIYFTADPDNK